MAKTESGRSRRKKTQRKVPLGIAHIQATFNNTIITISDMNGHVVTWASAGTVGFSGARKSTPFAAQVTAEAAAKKALELGMHEVRVHVNGPGAGRESAIRALRATGLEVSLIKDLTAIPHNGCRARKRRRV